MIPTRGRERGACKDGACGGELSRRSFTLMALMLLAPREARSEARPDSSPERVVCLQPLSPSPSDEEVQYVIRAISAFYDARVAVLPELAPPRIAYYAPRERYRAEKLLSFLGERLGHRGARIVGLTAADISTTKGDVFDWGILGLANMPGTSCVVSSFRCKKRASSPVQPVVRLGKTAVHELGHTFGLEHCRSTGCLMEDAGGSVLTTDREHDLCGTCRSFLAGQNVLRESGTIPWNDPR